MNLRRLISGIFGHGSHYLASGMVVTLINVISMPIYTRLFAPKEFGLYFTLMSVSQCLLIPYNLSLDSAMTRFYYEPNHSEARASFISTYLNFCLLWGLVFFGLFSLISPYTLERSLQIPFYPLLLLTYTLTLLQGLMVLLITVLRMEFRSATLGFLNFANASIVLLFTVLGVKCFGQGISARLTGQIIANSLFAIFVLALLSRRKAWRSTLHWPILREGFGYSLPLLPHAGAGWITSLSDRLLLGLYNMRASLSFYSLGYDLTRTAISMISDSVFQIYDPLFLKEMASGSSGFLKQHARFFTYYFLVVSAATFSLSIFSPEIIAVLTPKSYAKASALMPVIAYAYLFGALYKPFISMLGFMKKTFLISLLGLVSAVTNLGLNLLLIPRFGSTAAAWTTFGSVGLYFVGACAMAHYYLPTEWEYGRLGKIIAANVIAYLFYLGIVVRQTSLLSTISTKMVCIILFPIVLWGSRFFSDREISIMWQSRDLRHLWKGLLTARAEGLVTFSR